MGKELENTLYYGDNLKVLREHIADNSVDLIYLDPPFQSGRNYNVLFEEKNGTKSSAQRKAFEDTWHWDISAEETYREIIGSKHCPQKLIELITGLKQCLGNNDMMAYLVMMAIRLIELHRVLKDTGSIYLHCDTTASHYLKVLMDSIFGSYNFRNEIVWCYATPSGAANVFPRKHDTILFYTKTNDYTFNTQRIPHKSGLHNTGQVFGSTDGDNDNVRELEKLGKKVEDWWIDIYPVDRVRQERLGYQTQKPEALLERIITASSNEGAIVLDPFCGCGTTVAVAQRLKRRWIGIDITHLATYLIKRRLWDMFKDNAKYNVKGEPEDLSGAKELAKQDKYQFEWWVRGLVGARPPAEENKKGADKGVDGYIYFYEDISPDRKLKKIVVQIKGGENVGVAQVRDLRGTMERIGAKMGAFITLEEPTREMKKEAVSAGFYECPFNKSKYPKLQILTIEELLGGKKIDYPPWVEDATIKKARRYVEEQKITQHKLIEE
jgi:site-specific DNA-methyltransferase (adenine-specific)